MQTNNDSGEPKRSQNATKQKQETSENLSEELESSLSLSQLLVSSPLIDSVIHTHVFHSLLLRDSQSMEELVTNVTNSLLARESITLLSDTDTTRIRLHAASLCLTSEQNELSLKPDLLQNVNLRTWAWSPEEKELIRKRLKGRSRKRDSNPEEPSVPKRTKRSRGSESQPITGMLKTSDSN